MRRLSDFKVGQRVQTGRATDAWQRGDRFGVVQYVGFRYVHVKLEASGRRGTFRPDNLIAVEGKRHDPVQGG